VTAIQLPTDPEQLQAIRGVADAITRLCQIVLSSLHEIERRKSSVVPTRCSFLPGCGTSILQIGLSPLSTINQDLRWLANEAAPILDHLGLSERDNGHVQALEQPDNPLLLAGVVEWIDEAEASPTDFAPRELSREDQLRVEVLIPLVERLGDCAAHLSTRLGRKLNPPSLRERIQVDEVRALVTVDGKQYTLTANQALAIKYLVEANGGPLSGYELSRKLRQEFRLYRYVRQINYPELKSIFKKEDKPNGRYRIELPPLD
jgi:hypothetical protein